MSDQPRKSPERHDALDKPRVAGSANGATTTPTIKAGRDDSSDPLKVRKPG